MNPSIHQVMKRLLAGLCVMAFMAPAGAEPSSEVAFDLETLALLRAADPAAGEAKAKERKCSKCHGDAGVSEDPADANLAGMRQSYLYKQMMDFLTNKRDARDMRKPMKTCSPQDVANLAAWYASQTPAPQAEQDEVDPAIEKLVYIGDPSRLLKPCRSCHGRKGRGGQYSHAAIAGQNRDYFIDSLTQFKEGDRENDIYSRMRLIAEALTDEEIEGLAEFYSAPVDEDEDDEDDDEDEDEDTDATE